jgi:hypothetical protein
MLRNFSALQTGYSEKPFLTLTGSSPPYAAVSRLLWDAEAVALAPPCTGAVHMVHNFLLNILIVIILPNGW